MDYGELKTAVQNYCANSEASFVTNLPNFFIASEDIILSVVDMSSRWAQVATTALVDGTAEYTFGGTTEGILDVLSVRIAESIPATAGPVEDGPVIYLLQKDYDFLLEAYPSSKTDVTEPYKGVPKYYAISSSAVGAGSSPNKTIRLGPIPNAAYTMTLTYYAKSPSTSITGGVDDTTETWLSITYPSVLLDGALAQAYAYMKGEPDMIQLYEKRFMEGIYMIKNTDEARLSSDDFRPASPMSNAQVGG